jgi:putative nucleotidyltransferase with HDIG domain
MGKATHDYSDILSVNSLEESRDDGNLVGDAYDWTRKNVFNPLANRAVVEPQNMVAGLTGLNKWDHLEVPEAGFMSAQWLTQNIAGGLGMVVPYTIAGKAMGGGLRTAGARFGAAGLTASLMKSEQVASVAGAMVYDGLRDPHNGETRIGNMLGGGAGFFIFGKGNAMLHNADLSTKLIGRAVVGVAGAETQLGISKFASTGGLPTAEEFWQTAVSGAVMNNALPVAEDAITRGVVSTQMKLGLGAPADLYAQSTYGRNAVSGSPELATRLNQSPWAKVTHGEQNQFSTSQRNGTVELNRQKSDPSVLARELAHLKQAQSGTSEAGFSAAKEALSAGQPQLAFQLYKQTRALQEVEAHHSQHLVANQLKGSEVLNPENLALEIGAWIAPGGVTYEHRWRLEFAQFQESGGRYRPGTTLAATEAYMPEGTPVRRAPANEAEAASMEMRAIGTSLVRDLQQEGHIAVFAGGSVRDGMRGSLPKDYDIATSASPDAVEALFRSKGHTVIPVGKAFGVINVIVNGKQYEIATLRNDGQYSDGRRPDGVKYVGSLFEDASRRDLRFNAMFEDPTTNTVYDFFGGRQDIANKQIRTVGDPNRRFSEDLLRMLRIPRFLSRFEGYQVAPEVTEAIAANAHKINSVSGERVRDELSGVLTSSQPTLGLQYMMDTGLMHQVLPEVAATAGPRGMQDPIWHPEGLTWNHTKMVVNNLRGQPFETMLGGLLHDIGKPATQVIKPDGRISNNDHAEVGAQMIPEIARRLKLSNDQKSIVKGMVEHHMKMHVVDKMRPATLKDLLEKPYIEQLVALQHADATGTGRADSMAKSQRDFIRGKQAEFAAADPAQQLGAAPIVDGRWLIDAGIKPGQRLGAIKNQALEAQRNGVFSTPEQALEWLRQNIPEFGSK